MMTDLHILAQLFGVFFVIGLFTFGGGYAMLSLIQTQVVSTYGWLTESAFTDIVAISQMTPGPIGINCATYVGYNVMGLAGSFTATFAVVLPSFLVVLLLVKGYTKVKGNPLFEGMMAWIRPAVVGLIAAAAVMLAVHVAWRGTPLLSEPVLHVVRENFPDWKSWLLMAVAITVSLLHKTHPILLILAGGLAGLLLY